MCRRKDQANGLVLQKSMFQMTNISPLEPRIEKHSDSFQTNL